MTDAELSAFSDTELSEFLCDVSNYDELSDIDCQCLREAARRLAERSEDKERLDFVQEECLGLEPIEMPTGGGDADVGWRALRWHVGEKNPRVVAQVEKHDPRAVIDAYRDQRKGRGE